MAGASHQVSQPLPTPSTSHISFDNVYEPAEDSYLFLDALSSSTEKDFLRSRFSVSSHRESTSTAASNSPTVLEVGIGSGVVLAFLTAHSGEILGRTDILSFGTDINTFACHGAIKTVDVASRAFPTTSGCLGDVVNADLSSTFRDGCIDILIFNPPYVPTEAAPDLSEHDVYNEYIKKPAMESFERDSHLLSLSYAGGLDGMEVTTRLVDDLPRILHPTRGVAYILLCAQNKPLQVKDQIKLQHGFNAETIRSSGQQAGWEKLQILRVWKD
ncbi:hypothetical protein NA57DRAFT_42427 [Rhizodiscina lignyota]|uniref:Uncharacterized protein n=1 Tax=Rhizodiscina lignyota TaxID=1504668 RepID=A0A9P4IBN4_9PEZI|nr:hypothetical protein NA57DRAFT_42427 [Rhizodiscina lignyota]